MKKITYRKATPEDCYDLAVLKGIVWNTTYKGIYPDEKLTGYDITRNEAIFQNIVNNPDIELYVAIDTDKISVCCLKILHVAFYNNLFCLISIAFNNILCYNTFGAVAP